MSAPTRTRTADGPPRKLRKRTGRQPSSAAPRAEFGAPLWLFMSEPGLGRLLIKELKYQGIVARKARPEMFRLRNYDLAVLPSSQVKGNPKQSRIALNVLAAPVFGRGALTDRQLDRLADSFRQERADGFISTVAGAVFQRQDMLRWITKEVARRGIKAESKRRPAWLIVVDKHYWVGFPRANFHEQLGRQEASERHGALAPTIAAAMAFMTEFGRDEVICDPFMGTGTLLREALALAPDPYLIGCDVDRNAIVAARARMPKSARLQLIEGDNSSARYERLVTATLSNLPWGKQYATTDPLAVVYRRMLENTLSQASPRWRGCLLTSNQDALLDAIKGLSVNVEATCRIWVRGTEAHISLLRRV